MDTLRPYVISRRSAENDNLRLSQRNLFIIQTRHNIDALSRSFRIGDSAAYGNLRRITRRHPPNAEVAELRQNFVTVMTEFERSI